jgi:hypothetical protein
LFVRVKDDFSGWTAEVANWQRQSELTTTGFVELAFVHALLDDVQFSLRHGSFESEKETVIVPSRIIDPI